jgi:hypothetical protein
MRIGKVVNPKQTKTMNQTEQKVSFLLANYLFEQQSKFLKRFSEM